MSIHYDDILLKVSVQIMWERNTGLDMQQLGNTVTKVVEQQFSVVNNLEVVLMYRNQET